MLDGRVGLTTATMKRAIFMAPPGSVLAAHRRPQRTAHIHAGGAPSAAAGRTIVYGYLFSLWANLARNFATLGSMTTLQ